jgi:flagellar biosynthesis protein FlhF
LRRFATSNRPQVPEELFDYYMHLIDNQVADEIAMELVKSVREQLRPEQLSQPAIVNAKIAELLERLIPSAGPIVRTKTVGPHVVALIGPTGVGKTTTLAKLAANLKLREHAASA